MGKASSRLLYLTNRKSNLRRGCLESRRVLLCVIEAARAHVRSATGRFKAAFGADGWNYIFRVLGNCDDLVDLEAAH